MASAVSAASAGADRSRRSRRIAGVGNRTNIGSGNTINRGDVNVGGIRQNNLAGVGVDPGYGVRPPAYNNWRGAYWGYHQGWANGYWHGYHDNNNWGWGRFAAGAAVGVAAWALGSSFYDWGYASYANPYYAEAAAAEPIVIQQTIAGGEPQTVSVPALAYDYSQPIDTQAAPPPAEVADPAVAKFDAARRGVPQSGDYAGALRLTDEALKVLPNDATLHEFRALVLFAVGKYDLAAGPLYAVLSVGPGWDWTTMAGLYPGIDVYTAQLRKLEAFVKANPSSTAGRFVLAYHYLTQGHIDAAVAQLKQVVALAPRRQALRPARQAVLQARRRSPSTPPPACPDGGRVNRPSRASCPATGRRARPRTRPSAWTSGTTGPSPGRSTPRASRSSSRGSGRSPTTCSRSPSRGKAGPWSAASPGRPTTGGTSASWGPGPTTRDSRSHAERWRVRTPAGPDLTRAGPRLWRPVVGPLPAALTQHAGGPVDGAAELPADVPWGEQEVPVPVRGPLRVGVQHQAGDAAVHPRSAGRPRHHLSPPMSHWDFPHER